MVFDPYRVVLHRAAFTVGGATLAHGYCISAFQAGKKVQAFV
jgi:hypothetical protein